MTIVNSWPELVTKVVQAFPQTRRDRLLAREGDIGALVRHVADAHDLTFAEAAEVVTFRLPQYLEPARLSA